MPLARSSDPLEPWIFEDPTSGDALRLAPERGGLLTGWRCGGREMLYLDRTRFADPALSVRGGAPVLFPICGNLPGDRLTLPQGSFELRQHGFARDLPWRIEELANGDGVRLVLEDDERSRACFPFGFRLELDYRLEPEALAIRVRLEHRGSPGSPSLPWSFGLHPYLAVSDPAAVDLTGLPEHCLDHRTMEPGSTEGELQGLGRGVDFLCEARGPVRLLDPAAGRSVILETSPPFDLVVVWTEPPRPMLCLEPWTGPRGALLSGERRLELAPGESRELQARYRVEAL